MALVAAAAGSLAAWHDRPWQILAAMPVLGVGVGFAFAAMATLITEAVRPTETGVATGMNTVMRTVGGVIGGQMGAALLAAEGTLTHHIRSARWQHLSGQESLSSSRRRACASGSDSRRQKSHQLLRRVFGSS